MIDLLNLLAQATQGTPTSAPAPSIGDFFRGPIVPIILMVGVVWWFMSRSRRKEQQRYQDMLNSLKKNDRVQTIGGILGTVVDVREGEVVVKVDESSNVKIRFNRSAIKEVLREPAEPAK